MEYEQSTSPTVKDKVRHNLCLSSCCFGSSSRRDVLDSPSSDDRPKLLCAPSTWLKSRAHEFPEIKDRCRHLISRIGGKHHRRHSTSADFRYDPLSYAMNFDEGFDDANVDEAPLRNFCSRLPASPPTLETVPEAGPREVTCA